MKLEKCQRCGSNNIVEIVAKCPDGFDISINGIDCESASILNICGTEYVEPIICLDCGQCQGVWPVKFSFNPKQENPVTIDTYKSVKLLVDACKSHYCINKKLVPADDPRPYMLTIGFVCQGCGMNFSIKLKDIKLTGSSEERDWLEDARKRKNFCNVINKTN